MPHIVVIGSINMDLVCRARSIPRPGETLLGQDFVTIPGGKGANQAVAAAKLAQPGTTVYMVGRVGGDDFGQRLLNGLVQHGVNTTYVTVTENLASGVAMILVDRKGENSIVVAPGANAKLSSFDIDAAQSVIESAAAVVMQLEISQQTVGHAIAMCQRVKVYSILDPAPAPAKLPRALMGVDLISPNESEAQTLLGLRRTKAPKQVAAELLSRGARAVALKLGRKGSLWMSRGEGVQTAKPFKVRAVDTTAAGDAFTGALSVAHAEAMDVPTTLRFANAAGAICCQSFGAQPSLPSRAQVDQLLGITSAPNPTR